MEDFSLSNTDDRIKVFGSFSDDIYNFHYSQSLNCLFASPLDNVIKQYDLNEGASELKLVKEYKLNSFSGVSTFTICEGILAVASHIGEVQFVDIFKREILGITVMTAVKFIVSMKLCKVMGKTYLCVCGGDYKYSSEETDLYDVSEIMNLSIRKEDKNNIR
jgi:hypothetical protein